MQQEEVLKKTYLSDSVRSAIDASESNEKLFQSAIKSLEDSLKQQDALLNRREQLANEKLQRALEKLEAAKVAYMKQTEMPDYVLKTASGAEAQLQMAKMLPFLNEKRRKELQTGKDNLETLRYLSLARYLLESVGKAPTELDAIEQSVADALLLKESDLADLSTEERESAAEFKSKLTTLARRLQQNQEEYQNEVSHQQVLQLKLDQLKEATDIARSVVKKADPEDKDEALQRLRVELSNYEKLQEQLQRQTKVRDLETLALETRATALEISRLVEKQRQLALNQLLKRLSAALQKELNEKQEKESQIAAELQDALDAIKQQREEQNEIVETRIIIAEEHVLKLEEELENAYNAFAESEAALRKAIPKEPEFSLWPTSLAGPLKQFEEQIVGAMKKFNIAKMKLEDAKPDEIDPVTGKYVSCVTESLTLSEYQKALMHYVNDNFKVLPGVLILWEPGTGKTQGSISAVVENLKSRYVDAKKPKKSDGVDVLILGFTNDNLNDFRKTLFATLDRELEYELGKSGGDEESSQQVIRLKITGKDNQVRTANIVIQRYSVGASLAPQMKMNPDGIMLVDEAHFMVTREVPTASTNIAQVRAAVAAWEKVVTDFDGVKLLLTATPSGANRDPEMLFKLLKYMKFQRGEKKDDRDIKAYEKWFKPRADGLGVEWVSEEARREFEQNWLRARISYVALRFDKRVFPQIDTVCKGAKLDEQCVFEIDDTGALKLISDRPKLSSTEVQARQMLEYGRMAPTLVRVPMTIQESKDFEKKSAASATSENTRNPELAACAKSDKPLSELSDDRVEECAGYAHYSQKDGGKGGQWASGGGFDIESKAAAVHKLIDSVNKTTGSTRHVIIASGYENAGTRYFQTPLLKEFKDFEQIEQKHVSTDEAAAKTINLPKKRRLALLTGTTWTGTSQTKTAKNKQLMKKIFFSDANRDGSIIEVLIVDASMLTGFDAKGATHLHILSPVLNQQQAWSRILRRCAQPVATAQVYVYTYKTFIPDDVKAAKDNKITITPDEFVLESMRRKRQIVQPIDLLMQEMIAASYDRYWFADYSTGGGVKANVVAEGKIPVQPLTQSEYILWRVFDSLVPENVKEVDNVPQEMLDVKPIGVAATAQALGANKKKENKQGLALAAVAIAKRAQDAATRFFRRKKAAVDRQIGALPALPADLAKPNLPSRIAPRNDVHQFAQEYFRGEPWAVADPVRFSQANINDRKAQVIIEQLTSLVDMNMLADLSLLTAFVAEKLSDQRREQITAILDEKAIVTPNALMRSFEDYYILQELANAHYRQLIQKTVDLATAKQEETKQLFAESEALGKAPGPELPADVNNSNSSEPTSSATSSNIGSSIAETTPPALPPTPLPIDSDASATPKVSMEQWNQFLNDLQMTPASVSASPVLDVGQKVTYPNLSPQSTTASNDEA